MNRSIEPDDAFTRKMFISLIGLPLRVRKFSFAVTKERLQNQLQDALIAFFSITSEKHINFVCRHERKYFTVGFPVNQIMAWH